MENNYIFKCLKITSSEKININSLNFIKNIDNWFSKVDEEINILEQKNYNENNIVKLLNIQFNILSEVYIHLSNIKINNFKIEIIKKKI